LKLGGGGKFREENRCPKGGYFARGLLPHKKLKSGWKKETPRTEMLAREGLGTRRVFILRRKGGHPSTGWGEVSMRNSRKREKTRRKQNTNKKRTKPGTISGGDSTSKKEKGFTNNSQSEGRGRGDFKKKVLPLQGGR